MNKKLHLHQVRHPYAPKQGFGEIYLPSSLLIAGQQMSQSGYEISQVTDGNINHFKPQEDELLGISVIGAPYIPEVQNLIAQVRSQVILGGQIINGLSDIEFKKLFGPQAIKATNFPALTQGNPESVSLIPLYEKIGDIEMQKYLEKEMCLYLSNKCSKACKFCGAARSWPGKKAKESYRHLELVDQDLRYLVKRASTYGLGGLKIYLSNLDLFQSQSPLELFVSRLEALKTDYPDFKFSFRGLSCVDSFMRTRKNNPELIERFSSCGLDTLGFGIDGVSPRIWKAIKKSHNRSLDNCTECIRSAHEDFSITPEALMVIGHVSNDRSQRPVEDKASLDLTYGFASDMLEFYSAIPRSHIAKSIPGSEIWLEHRHKLEILFKNTETWQSLDFLAYATGLTQGSKDYALMVNGYHDRLCSLFPEKCSQPIIPIEPDLTSAEVVDIRIQNLGKYDR